MPRGGKRPGAGRKKETATSREDRQRRSIEKEVLREETRQIIAPHLERLLLAQIAHAEGLKYLVTRDKKTGKFIRVTETMARRKQDDAENEETIEVWEKDPSTQAFTDLLNRLLDKPKEQEQEIKLTGEVTLGEKIARARARLDRLKETA